MDQHFKEVSLPRADVRILVVDDREDSLLSIESILEKDGYTVVKAASGIAALKILLHEQDFALILMDVQMPGMNGFETANLIYERERLRYIPIIFITAINYGEEYIFRGYRTGGVDYIYKPLNPELLRMKVGVFVELYRKTQQLLAQEQKLIAMNRDLGNEIEERRHREAQVTELNRQLIENNASLQSMNEELDRFAYIASHDLQEPLRKIMVFSDKLAIQHGKDLKGDTGHYLQKIIRSAERMQLLIQDLLRFSRNTGGHEEFVPVNLHDLLQEVLSDMEVEIGNKRAAISIDALPRVHVIPSQFRQLFQNLIANSLKFSKKDTPPHIRIYSSFVNDAGGTGHYRISFSDNGIGFDPRYKDDIFVVFKRLHSYHEFEGTGVGLSICKKIIERHKGYITAEGRPGEGATFVIGLPGND